MSILEISFLIITFPLWGASIAALFMIVLTFIAVPCALMFSSRFRENFRRLMDQVFRTYQ